MLELISRIFGKETSSKDIARERLRLVLVHDRSTVSPEVINLLRDDLIQVIQKYMDIDLEGLLVNIEGEDNSVALIANIPIKGLKRASAI
ncbi:MAG: cell division topological specificity factor MinE [Syntrophomonadaceae bacterium]|nr:cell division topological specificity factor MinE [Syntrophomonadaceae bacterium]